MSIKIFFSEKAEFDSTVLKKKAAGSSVMWYLFTKLHGITFQKTELDMYWHLNFKDHIMQVLF